MKWLCKVFGCKDKPQNITIEVNGKFYTIEECTDYGCDYWMYGDSGGFGFHKDKLFELFDTFFKENF